MYGFDEIIRQLKDQFDVVTLSVFIIVFAIVYAFLDKTSILGKNKKGMNTIVSLILALIFVAPHVTPAIMNTPSDPVYIISNSLPTVLIWVIAIFMFFLILAMFGISKINVSNSWVTSSSILVLGIGIILYAFGTAAGWFGMPNSGGQVAPWVNGLLNNSDFWSIVIIIVSFIIIIMVVIGPSEKKNKDHEFAKSFANTMKGLFNEIDKK